MEIQIATGSCGFRKLQNRNNREEIIFLEAKEDIVKRVLFITVKHTLQKKLKIKNILLVYFGLKVCVFFFLVYEMGMCRY